MVKPLPVPTQNSLFASFSAEARDRLAPDLKLVSLNRSKVLYTPEAPMTHVYFPIDAIVALVYLMDDGSSSEISMVGNEGIVGIFSMLSDETTSTQAQVLSSGYAFSLPKKKMQAEFNRHDGCSLILLRYVQALFAQMSQTAVCNRHHTIDQQLCRLLLLSLDRLPCNNLSMTHDLIARMLGVRRGGVSEAAGRLQKAGVIEYHRGHIKVLDRHSLEESSCECYSVVKKQTDKLLPTATINNIAQQGLKRIQGGDPTCALCFKYNSCIYLKKLKKRPNRELIASV